LAFRGTLIFSKTFALFGESTDIGSTSFVVVDFAASNSLTFVRWARRFSLLMDILWGRDEIVLRSNRERGDKFSPVLPESVLSPFLDLSYPFHRLESRLHKLAVVTNWDVSSFFELERRILGGVC
jgi:hypothetical protein